MKTLSVAALRARLLARGLTVSPTCPVCHQERDKGDFMPSGACRYCQIREDHARAVLDAAYGDTGVDNG